MGISTSINNEKIHQWLNAYAPDLKMPKKFEFNYSHLINLIQERDMFILSYRVNGMTLDKIGSICNPPISKERVRQRLVCVSRIILHKDNFSKVIINLSKES